MTRILAYDNEEDILEAYRLLLKNLSDYEISATRKNSVLMELLEKEKFDLLLYDIPHAPIESGRIFCKEAIDNLETIHRKYPKLPVIAFSTEPMIYRAKTDFGKLGVVKGMEKPFEARKLIESIKEALDKRI